MKDIARFLDENQRVTVWPSKIDAKIAILSHIADKFEKDRQYTEKEVNTIITNWHTFGDYFLIRRSLIDYGYLSRTRNGASYWKKEKEPDNARD